MTNRRLLLIGIVVTVVLGLGVYDALTHVMRGLVRGEAFFDGRPTSWWRSAVIDALETRFFTRWHPFGRRLAWDPNIHIARELGLSQDAEEVLEDLASDRDPKVSAIANDLLLVIRGQTVRPYPEVWSILLQKHRIR